MRRMDVMDSLVHARVLGIYTLLWEDTVGRLMMSSFLVTQSEQKLAVCCFS